MNRHTDRNDISSCQSKIVSPHSIESSQTNGPYENAAQDHYARVQRIERPKSVPPNMFNAMLDQSNFHPDGSNPVPPPRRIRDSRDSYGGSISLLREPEHSNRSPQSQGSNTMSGVIPRTSNQQSAGQFDSSGTSGRQLPLGGIQRSQTPTARIQPQTKLVQKPQAPKPSNDGSNKDPKANAVWKRR
ncbi:hypothetical protein ScPMuIL_014752 [Solemya velum]